MLLIDTIVVLKNSDIRGILCRETASYFHNLSTFPPDPIFIYQEQTLELKTGIFRNIFQNKLDLRYTKKIGLDLYVLDEARTIIDMIISNSNERFIYESVERYQWKQLSIPYLLEVADFYRIGPEISYYLETLEDYLFEL